MNPPRSSFTIHIPALTAYGAKRRHLEVRQDGKTVRRCRYDATKLDSGLNALRRAQEWINQRAPRADPLTRALDSAASLFLTPPHRGPAYGERAPRDTSP